MKITSPAFKNNTEIPAKYTCDGENINPELTIEDLPDGAQSLVLIFDDPDAPNGTWTHWTVWNIGADINKIAENSVPEEATEGTTSFGRPGYGGPCPPLGKHRYCFRIYALDTGLDLDSMADVSKLNQAMENHVLGQAELVGVYSR